MASMVQLFASTKLSPLKIRMVSFWERAKWSCLSVGSFGGDVSFACLADLAIN